MMALEEGNSGVSRMFVWVVARRWVAAKETSAFTYISTFDLRSELKVYREPWSVDGWARQM